jgi:hypothetical protein
VSESAGVLGLTTELLAPGDGKSSALDPAAFAWTRIRSADDPAFRAAYATLWAEFGAAHEMETADILATRFASGPGMQYEIMLVRAGEAHAAVRDHTAIWADGEVVVHLSHVIVMEPWRRSGLAGWMRAAPILVARELAALHGAPEAQVTLIGEMEYDDGSEPKRGIRLKAYERAGFGKVDPVIARYHQPDFRSPAEIDASGGPRPLPFQLIVRQVGREEERTVSAARVQRWVQALYAMYGAQFRPADMAHPQLRLDHYAKDPAAEMALLPPTQP